MKLTKRAIDAIENPRSDLVIRDDEFSGFALRVYPSGRKVFLAQYRVGGGRTGRQRKVTIGTYGTITADEARTKAREILAKAHLGQGFAEERARARKSLTVSQLIDNWSKDGALINRRTGAARKQANINNDINLANHHIRLLLGTRTVDTLTKGDILRLRTQIASGESKAKRKGNKRGLIKVTGATVLP